MKKSRCRLKKKKKKISWPCTDDFCCYKQLRNVIKSVYRIFKDTLPIKDGAVKKVIVKIYGRKLPLEEADINKKYPLHAISLNCITIMPVFSAHIFCSLDNEWVTIVEFTAPQGARQWLLQVLACNFFTTCKFYGTQWLSNTNYKQPDNESDSVTFHFVNVFMW